MRMPRPSRTALSFLLPTLVLPLGMLVASIMAVTQPVSVAPKLDPVPVEPVEPPAPTRVYHAFLNAVTVSLPEGNGNLSMQLAVALPDTSEKALEPAFDDSSEAFLNNLATVILEAVTAAKIGGDPTELRRMMPDVLKVAINDNLAAMGAPPDILEVLIVDWALVR